jgi:hypothetical protein
MIPKGQCARCVPCGGNHLPTYVVGSGVVHVEHAQAGHEAEDAEQGSWVHVGNHGRDLLGRSRTSLTTHKKVRNGHYHFSELRGLFVYVVVNGVGDAQLDHRVEGLRSPKAWSEAVGNQVSL